MRPVSAQTLQRLEEEAEVLYRREAPPESGAAELVRRYESLAELSVQRSPHAWLRIGNIHQRAGSVGAAIDAYRKVLFAATAQPSATTAERKALLNLAGLALEQARQSLTRLAALPAEEETSATVARYSKQAPAHSAGALPTGHGASATASPDDVLQAQMESLQRHLRRHQERQTPLPGSENAAAVQRSPYVVERYTASGRRNAVKAARGSLHVNPADGLPAAPVAKGRPRVPAVPLPSVEYLLGNPLRSVDSAEVASAADKPRAGTARPSTSRSAASLSATTDRRGEGAAGTAGGGSAAGGAAGRAAGLQAR
ncbi:MAG: hypothetical protein H0T52_03505 [Lautropia sp.]|nr:hypothetical protein [Lautropia sp.]